MTARGALLKYDEARSALAHCVRVDEAKSIRDKAEALRVYARQRDDHELETWVAEIKIRANRRLGELTAALPKAKAGTSKNGKRGGTNELPTGGKFKAEVLAEAGVSTAAAHRCEPEFSVAVPSESPA